MKEKKPIITGAKNSAHLPGLSSKIWNAVVYDGIMRAWKTSPCQVFRRESEKENYPVSAAL